MVGPPLSRYICGDAMMNDDAIHRRSGTSAGRLQGAALALSLTYSGFVLCPVPYSHQSDFQDRRLHHQCFLYAPYTIGGR